MEIIIKKKKIVTVSNGKIRKYYVGKGMEATLLSTNKVSFSVSKGNKSIKGIMTFGDHGKLVEVDCVATEGKKVVNISISK